MPPVLTPARKLAETFFKKTTVPAVASAYEVSAQDLRKRTAHLRGLRLAKEAANRHARALGGVALRSQGVG